LQIVEIAMILTPRHCMSMLVILPAMMLCCTNGGADQPVSLKPKLKPGHAFYVEMEHDAHYVWREPNGSVERTQYHSRQVEGLTWTVRSQEPDGRASVTLTFDRFAMCKSDQAGAGDYDSDDRATYDAGEYYHCVFRPMLRESVELRVGANRRAESVDGVRRVLRKVEAAAGASSFLEAIRSEYFTGDYWRVQADRVLLLYPDRAVGVGDTWQRELRFEGIIQRYTFKLARFGSAGKRRIANVTFTSTLSHEEEDELDRGWGAVTVVALSGDSSGEAQFDVESGELLNASERVKQSMCVRIAQKGAEPYTMRGSKQTERRIRLLSVAERERDRAGKPVNAP
jgi:hypothetical protein